MGVSAHRGGVVSRAATLVGVAIGLMLISAALASSANALTTVWATQFVAPFAGDSYFQTAAMAPSGDIVVVGGGPMTADYSCDATVSKYNAAGRLLWTRSWSAVAPDQFSDFRFVDFDEHGDIYVASNGYVGNVGETVLAKYSPDGKRRWLRELSPVDGASYSATAIAATSEGSVYVCGDYSMGFEEEGGFALAKIDKNGSCEWVVSEKDIHFEKVAVGAKDAAYLTGVRTSSTPSWNQACVTRRYSACGRLVWSDSYLPENRVQAEGLSLLISGNDAIVVGHSYMSDVGQVGINFVIDYSGDGSRRWLTTWVPDKDDVWLGDPVKDRAGNIWLASNDAWGAGEPVLLKLDRTGAIILVQPVTISGSTNDRLKAIGIDTRGRIVLAGTTFSDDGLKVVIGKADSEGNLVSGGLFPATGTDFYDPVAFLLARDGSVYMASNHYLETWTEAGFLVDLAL